MSKGSLFNFSATLNDLDAATVVFFMRQWWHAYLFIWHIACDNFTCSYGTASVVGALVWCLFTCGFRFTCAFRPKALALLVVIWLYLWVHASPFVFMGMISRHVEINSAVFTCACLFRMFVETHQPLFQKVIMHGKKNMFSKRSLLGLKNKWALRVKRDMGMSQRFRLCLCSYIVWFF